MRRLIACLLSAAILSLPAAATAQNLLTQPEGAAYDASRDCYLVCNVANGNIIRIDASGAQSYFNTDLAEAMDVHIVGDVVYVASSEPPDIGLIGSIWRPGQRSCG
ncbi:MAG TPA: hypothetical protein VM118_02310 [Acidobacteriota bacterium]|nr:hypothetical protein [Acidobacteriota bacterium]